MDWRYEVTIGTLEASESGGTSWLGIGQKRNYGGRISYARTSIEATRKRGASSEFVETDRDGGTIAASSELVAA
ncbi:hypothetical protein TIFTF001_012016 [Ficus carica]|uniref:Uncharacterized protein n=1 Tax=Ficus carica TaxID=3494 RepID=A0AA88D1A8_FICCA|nr:hypothetical protein TIFTF001_012016 [Ficus carica]